MSRPPRASAARPGGRRRDGGRAAAGVGARDGADLVLARRGLAAGGELQAHLAVAGLPELAGEGLGVPAQEVVGLGPLGEHHRLEAALGRVQLDLHPPELRRIEADLYPPVVGPADSERDLPGDRLRLRRRRRRRGRLGAMHRRGRLGAQPPVPGGGGVERRDVGARRGGRWGGTAARLRGGSRRGRPCGRRRGPARLGLAGRLRFGLDLALLARGDRLRLGRRLRGGSGRDRRRGRSGGLRRAGIGARDRRDGRGRGRGLRRRRDRQRDGRRRGSEVRGDRHVHLRRERRVGGNALGRDRRERHVGGNALGRDRRERHVGGNALGRDRRRRCRRGGRGLRPRLGRRLLAARGGAGRVERGPEVVGGVRLVARLRGALAAFDAGGLARSRSGGRQVRHDHRGLLGQGVLARLFAAKPYDLFTARAHSSLVRGDTLGESGNGTDPDRTEVPEPHPRGDRPRRGRGPQGRPGLRGELPGGDAETFRRECRARRASAAAPARRRSRASSPRNTPA